MRIKALMAALALSAGCASAPAAEDDSSWGKADVTLVQYLTDAATCAAASVHARAEPEALVQRNNSSQDSHDALLQQANSQQEAQLRADARARQIAHDQCLRDLGYVQFRLSPAQRAHLRALAPQSEERRAYLHQLGSDAAVLAAQRI